MLLSLATVLSLQKCLYIEKVHFTLEEQAFTLEKTNNIF